MEHQWKNFTKMCFQLMRNDPEYDEIYWTCPHQGYGEKTTTLDYSDDAFKLFGIAIGKSNNTNLKTLSLDSGSWDQVTSQADHKVLSTWRVEFVDPSVKTCTCRSLHLPTD
jgi:hypothetical protein